MQKKSKVAIWALLCVGFLLFVLGGILLIAGAYFTSDPALYIGIGLLLSGMCFYIAVGIILLVIYLKRKKG